MSRFANLEQMEMTFTIEDADLDKLNNVLKDINVRECPWFEVHDKHGNKAKYYREPHWIPVTEALPKEEDCPMDCLVTRKSKFIGNYTDMAVCEKNGTWTHEDWDAIVLGDVEDGKSTGLISTRDDNIIAWMPLPEPWKGEEYEL